MGVVRNQYLFLGTRISFLLKLVFFVFIWSLPSVASQTRMALVIGNAAYDNLSRLENPVRDAQDIAETLSSLGFRVYLATDAEHVKTRAAIALFSQKASKADVTFIYYAGHGQVKNGDTHVFGTDFDQSTDAAISFNSIAAQFKDNQGQIIWVFDSCSDIGVDPLSIGNQAGEQALMPAGLQPLSVNLRANDIAVFASAPGKAAYDGQGNHSVFSGALLDELIRPNTPIETVFRNVRTEVFKNSDAYQLPVSHSTLLSPIILAPEGERDNGFAAAFFDQETNLQNDGFARKPVLQNLASGFGVDGRPIRLNLNEIRQKAKLCKSLQSPLPAECLRLVTDLQLYLRNIEAGTN